jgi:hypothetical protein
MKNGKHTLMPIPVDGEIKSLVKEATRKTRLSQAAVIRSALLIGVPEVEKRLVPRRPRRSAEEVVDTLFSLGRVLTKRNRELVRPSRFE